MKPESLKPSPENSGTCLKLDLNFFKTQPCKIKEPHLPKRCPFYHDPKRDRRRPPNLYCADMCVYALNEKECPYGDSCQNAHNRVEEFYHPTKYRSRFCTYYPTNIASCEYGDFCCFAHSELDIGIDLLHLIERDTDFYMFHYKTAWCPFNETNHDREKCVYAHNWQDFRRKPNQYNYRKDQCGNWSNSKIINVYFDGCINGLKCQYSHGWKEQEFHPLNYKVNACRHGEGCTKSHCPFFHSEKDRRTPTPAVFTLVPKNRSIGFPSQGYPDQHTLQTQSQTSIRQEQIIQPVGPSAYVGSPMEGMAYFAQYVSPYASPHISPHISPVTSPPDSPKSTPVNAYYVQTNPYMGSYYPQANPMPTGYAEIQPVHQKTKITTKAAPFIPKNIKKPASPKPESPRDPPKTEQKTDFRVSKEIITEETKKDLNHDDSLSHFLNENKLGHLIQKFTKYGLTENSLLSMTEESLNSLGLTKEDKEKLHEAIEKTKKSGQRVFANLIDFD